MKSNSLSNNVILFCFFLGIALGGCEQKKESGSSADEKKPVGRTLEYVREIEFLTPEGELLSRAEVAEAKTQQERNMGLMDVRNLPNDKGMMFFFEKEEPLSFWMANTPLPLDIFFINSDSVIVRIHRNARPFSEENLTSDKPAKYVVEMNAGYALNHDINEGYKVRF